MIGKKPSNTVSFGPSGIANIPRPGFFGIDLSLHETTIYIYFLLIGLCLLTIFIVSRLKNSRIGRAWVALREDEIACEAMGVNTTMAKLSAFAVSSFIIGISGALWGFVHLGSWEPLAFNLTLSLNLLFMIILGGMGSLLGCYFGAAFIVILPIVLDQAPLWLGAGISTATASHLAFMIFGALIVVFLIVEPHGLARLWAIGKEKLRLWPFPH